MTADATPPRFFYGIGRSWLVMGLAGVLMGLLSLPGLAHATDLTTLLVRRGVALPPRLIAEFDNWLRWVAPVTFAQIGLSALMTAGAAGFLKRKRAGRLALEIANAVTIASVLGSAWLAGLLMERLAAATGLSSLIAAGELANVPAMTTAALWGVSLVMEIPLLWMAWWFRSEPVRAYADIGLAPGK